LNLWFPLFFGHGVCKLLLNLLCICNKSAIDGLFSYKSSRMKKTRWFSKLIGVINQFIINSPIKPWIAFLNSNYIDIKLVLFPNIPIIIILKKKKKKNIDWHESNQVAHKICTTLINPNNFLLASIASRQLRLAEA